MDNLAPLRELARSGVGILDQNFKLFPAQPGVLAEFRSFDGPRFAVDATYEAENKGTAVGIPVWVKPGIKKVEKPKGKDDNDLKGEKKGDEKDKKVEDKDKKAALKEKNPEEKDKDLEGKAQNPEVKDKTAEVNEKKDAEKKVGTARDTLGKRVETASSKATGEPASAKVTGEPASAKAMAKKGEPASAKAMAGKKEKATIMIFDMNGDTIRRFKTDLDSAFSSSIWWGKDTKGVRFPSKNEPGADQLEPGGGPQVMPGEYWVKAEYMGYRDSIKIRVIGDPRLNITAADREAKIAAIRDLYKTVERTTKAYDRLKEVEKTIGLVESQFVNVPDSLKKEVNKLGATLKDSIGVLKEKFFQHKEVKGIQRNSDLLTSRFWNAFGYIDGGSGAPNAAAQTAIAIAKREAESIVSKINMLLETQWKNYRARVEEVKFSVFKDFDKL